MFDTIDIVGLVGFPSILGPEVVGVSVSNSPYLCLSTHEVIECHSLPNKHQDMQ
jgi:hypothetical protein